VKQLAVLFFVVLAAACSGPSAQSALTPGVAQHARYPLGRSSPTPIQYVVVIMQENRSFDNFFRGFPKADSATFGMGHGVKYPLQALPLKWTHDMNHYHWQFLEDYDSGKNDGFDNQIIGFKSGPKCKDPVNHPACWIFQTGKVYQKMAYSYVKKSDIQPYWTMANQYTLGDHNFTSNNGPSFGAHQYMISGEEGHAAEVPSTMPWGCDAPKETLNYLQFGQANPPEFPAAVGHEVQGPNPCFTYPTAADLLDNAGVSWRYYVQHTPNNGYWLSAFDAISAIRNGPDWANVVSPDCAVLDDIKNGTLQHVSWVMPHSGASDHAGGGSGAAGPDWVASIVNAIGASPYWENTAIIINWDEWGGWYDHVKPPQYPDPQTGAYEGLGYRTPLIIVSPYAKNHYVSKVQHETASSLHFIEKTFGLPSLGTADARADAYDDVFDYTKQPTKFVSIKPNKNGSSCSPSEQPEIDY